MRITVDTNILVRAAIGGVDPETEDGRQSARAAELLRRADLVAIPAPVLCEFTWVLRRVYRHSAAEVAASIRKLCASEKVGCDYPAVEAGLDFLLAGGDFADGVIAHMGRAMGAEVFFSFDQQAVRLLSERGHDAAVPV